MQPGHAETDEAQVRAGMSVGHSPDEAQWTPDMRKHDITEAEKKEAKRRIQGNVGMHESSGDSGEEGEEQPPTSPRKLSTAPTVHTLAASAM